MTILIHQTLKTLLKNNDLSVAKLSRETTVPVQTLHNWLNGQEPRSLAQVKKIADYFKVTTDYLIYGVGERRQRKIEQNPINEYSEEINAGIFEVVLRRVR